MSTDPLPGLLRVLSSTIRVGKPTRDETEATYYVDESSDSFVPASSLAAFHEAIDRSTGMIKEVEQTISSKDVTPLLQKALADSARSKRALEVSDLRKVIRRLLDAPAEKWLMFTAAPVAHIESEDELNMGPSTLTKRSRFESQHASDENRKFSIGRVASEFVLQTVVIARGFEKAHELAVQNFELSQDLLAFILARYGMTPYARLRASQPLANEYIAGFTDRRMYSYQSTGPPGRVSLRPSLITDSTHGFDVLWAVASTAQRSEMEERIVRCAAWIGRGALDADDSRALVQFVYGLEALLTGAAMKQGVTDNVSESVALLLGASCDERIRLEAFMREAYGRRSGIAHGGTADVPFHFRQEVRQLSERVVERFLVDPELRRLRLAKDLHDELLRRKYGSQGGAT